MNDRFTTKEMSSGSCDVFKFWEKSDNILETVQGRDMVTMKV